MTGKGQIFKAIASMFFSGNDVFHNKILGGIPRKALTVLATAISPFFNFQLDFI